MLKLVVGTLALVLSHEAAYAQTMRWVQAKTAVSPPARWRSAMAYDAARGKIVLFWAQGGLFSASTWTLDGKGWNQESPSKSPTTGEVMAYDAARRETVLFTLSGSKGETWVWDGKNWTKRSTTSSPKSQSAHAMAYDAARQRIVLFGGYTRPTYLSETWEWDGKAWLQLKPKTSPPARSGHAMVYDSVRKEIVMFGGWAPNKFSRDTWTWDGKTWTQKQPLVSPAARSNHSMAFAQNRQQTILFGGSLSINTRSSETWTWDGKTWKIVRTNPTPAARWGQSMAYDAKRQEVVLFGGYHRWSLNDTWKMVEYSKALATQYGSGCGAFPGVRLMPASASLPVLGEKFTMQILGLPSTTTAGLLALGASKSRFGSVRLPLDLGPMGMKGCYLYNSFDIQFVFSIQRGLGSYTLPVPYLGQIKGSKIFLQAFGVDRIANRLGFVSSNGLELVPGYR